MKKKISKPISRQTDSHTMETTTMTLMVVVWGTTAAAAVAAAMTVVGLTIDRKERKTTKEMKFTWKILDFSIRQKNYIIQAQIRCKVSMPIACVRCPHELPNIEVEKPKQCEARQSKAIK